MDCGARVGSGDGDRALTSRLRGVGDAAASISQADIIGVKRAPYSSVIERDCSRRRAGSPLGGVVLHVHSDRHRLEDIGGGGIDLHRDIRSPLHDLLDESTGAGSKTIGRAICHGDHVRCSIPIGGSVSEGTRTSGIQVDGRGAKRPYPRWGDRDIHRALRYSRSRGIHHLHRVGGGVIHDQRGVRPHHLGPGPRIRVSMGFCIGTPVEVVIPAVSRGESVCSLPSCRI